ncbi:MAG: gamma-glutamyltransferase [Candidatus Neomarinimicrobiota bacterium]|nr:gamma-glutamyltransferase [Candidatus Neomarinimicrobiota bacterium]
MCFKRYFVTATILLLSIFFSGCTKENLSFYTFEGTLGQKAEEAVGKNGVVSSVHPLASEVGIEVLKSGGNAVDAAIATGLALGVVDQANCGLGGGAFIVIRLADGTVHTIDGREMAPARAHRDMYIRDGKADPDLSQRGPLAVGVPGVPAAYMKALELGGTISLEELIKPATAIARDGFILDDAYVNRYKEATERLRKDPSSATVYFHKDGSELEVGELFVQPLLAETYEKFGAAGFSYFYRGEFAQKVDQFMLESGGLITKEDMANYKVVERDPITGSYKGYEIYGMGPPSSGGVHLVQILNMIEASGTLDGKSRWDEESVFLTSKFMDKAFKDRAEHLGDADFYPVPVEKLISKSYAQSLVEKVMDVASVGPLDERFALDYGPGHTTNFAVIDKWGNAIAINHTVNLTYGAQVTVPGTGVALNSEMDDFSAQPGVPNAFGLIGAEANAIAPGKRPLSSMSPTIVVKDGKSVLILGGAGGPRIITAVLHTVLGVLDFELSVGEALSLPRFHHQHRPEALFVESHMPESQKKAMKARGYRVLERDGLGTVRAISWSEKHQAYVGAADPRTRNGVGAKAY